MTDARWAVLTSVAVANRVGVGATFVRASQSGEAEAAEAAGQIENKGGGYWLTMAGAEALAARRIEP
ncbi:MAG: hypothetical protein HQL38_20280 [Alphaproteobacteria bacterium]|nr:hypothetical protein [Alphaproteobacteria bacterium]